MTTANKEEANIELQRGEDVTFTATIRSDVTKALGHEIDSKLVDDHVPQSRTKRGQSSLVSIHTGCGRVAQSITSISCSIRSQINPRIQWHAH
jgi:hypothetical protein